MRLALLQASYAGSRAVLASETKTGEVTVANGDAAARGQEEVDRGHQAAEQHAGGQEADGCSLGHECPLSDVRSSSAS